MKLRIYSQFFLSIVCQLIKKLDCVSFISGECVTEIIPAIMIFVTKFALMIDNFLLGTLVCLKIKYCQTITLSIIQSYCNYLISICFLIVLYINNSVLFLRWPFVRFQTALILIYPLILKVCCKSLNFLQFFVCVYNLPYCIL